MRKSSLLLTTLLTFGVLGQAQAEKWLIYGGPNKEVFLGCLNCSDLEFDSVNNDTSRYASDLYEESIFNKYGRYGSDSSRYSPCNEYATKPPLVKDETGKKIGVLTINEAKTDAIIENGTINWLKNVVCVSR